MPTPTKPKILFYAPILEYPPAGGPQISVINAIKVLNQVAELHIVTTVPPHRLAEPETKAFLQQHCHALVHAPSSRLTSSVRLLDRAMRRGRRVGGAFVAPFDVGFIERYADAHGIDVFWIDRVLEHAFGVFRLLRRRRPKALIVGDTEAVHSRFIMREIPLIRQPVKRLMVSTAGRRIERQERQLTALADAVTAVSEVDADYYRSIASDKSRIHRFSNIIDIDDYRSPVAPPPSFRQPCLLLLGSFGRIGSPMDRAAIWLAYEIMPLVRQRVPDVHLYVIGRNADLTQAGLNGDHITVVGQIPSVLPYLQHAAATLVPLRYESGTRFKIVESGAASIPCVSTTLGAEGLDIEHGKNILIADTTETFADAIISLLEDNDLQQRLGEDLHQLVSDKYSLKTQLREGEAILSCLGVLGHSAHAGQGDATK